MSLLMGYPEYLAEVAQVGGYDEDDATTITDIHRVMDSGLAEFYQAHRWSFLTPTTTLSVGTSTTGTMSGVPVYSSTTEQSAVPATADVFTEYMVGEQITFDTSGTGYAIVSYTSGTVLVVTGDASGETSGDTFVCSPVATFELPTDFGSLATGVFQYARNIGCPSVVSRTLDYILSLRASSNRTGDPTYAALRPLSSDQTAIQRWAVTFWPTPNVSRTLTYQYRAAQNPIRSATPYPLGNEDHSQTILAFMLAVLEDRRNDDGESARAAKAQRSLAKSIQRDNDLSPRNLGYCGDTSDLTNYDPYGSNSHDFSGTTFEVP